MKKIFATVIIAASLSGIIAQPKQAQAADISVGLYSYYTWWNPAWRSVYSNVENDPMLIWGPYLAVTFFNKLSFSAMFLKNFTNEADSSYTLNGTTTTNGAYTLAVDTTINRNELDLTAGYRFTPRLNLYIGCKYLFYNMGVNGDNDVTLDSSYAYTVTDDQVSSKGHDIGAALGASYTIPIAGGLSFTAGNTVVLFSSNIDLITTEAAFSDTTLSRETDTYQYKSLGDNVTGTFSYYVPSLSTSFSIGGRFQVLKHFPEGDAPSMANDYFYGATFSAILQI